MTGENDIIDNVMLSPATVEAWHKMCQAALRALAKKGVGINADDFGLESATVGTGGELVLRATLPFGELCMKVPQGDWCYATAKASIN